MRKPAKLKYQHYEVHLIDCCTISGKYDNEHEALDDLLAHIRKAHKKYYEILTKSGRRLAMSQNGCGYSDDGKTKEKKVGRHNWNEPGADGFRQAWISNSLKKALEEKS